jgi:hypothetical protein
MSTEWPILQQALARGREAVCAHMSVADVIGLTWKEETITDLLVCAVSPSVKAITFTRHEEKKTGADWLWWFLDPDGISFGMLVQAKRLKISHTQWSFDFDYGKGSQRLTLMQSARHLGVAPAYGLYLGTPEYRGHLGTEVGEMVRRTVSVTPALGVMSGLFEDQQSTYGNSTALEDSVISDLSARLAIPTVWATLTTDLRDFLQQPQRGARAIAKQLLAHLLKLRLGKFTLAGPEVASVNYVVPNGSHDKLRPLFDEFPDDRGHFNEPYFQNVLRGLRPAPPDYVLEVVHDDRRQINNAVNGGHFLEHIGGIAVFQTA